MDSMAIRRSDSQAMSKKAGNSPCRQVAAIASRCSSSTRGFSPQRTPYNSTRQSLSRSYDSPEGMHRILQPSAKKCGSPMLRSSASPPASSSVRKHLNPPSERNQTILDDAAWMTERIQHLQKTGFLRHPSMSKLREYSGYISSPVPSVAASNEDYEKMSCCSPSTIQSSNSLQNQIAITYADEPLSAFRLSEVTLSEEDLLTAFSASTCNSSPVSLQSGCMFDRTAEDYFQGNSCSHDAERAHSDIKQQDSTRPSLNSPLKVRGDLLHRLEALQQRAELAAKIDFNQDNKYLKDPWDGQVLQCNQDSLSSTHSQSAITQQSPVLLAAASPTNSKIESPSWQPAEPENSYVSTSWPHKEVKMQPYVRHLIYSSSRIIRPEYYLPLSKEEQPAHKAVASCLPSSNNGRKLVPKDDNFKRSALRRSSSLCQQRSVDVSPGKCLSSHKQTHPARKSRRSMETFVDSVKRSVTARGSISLNGFSLPESYPAAAREREAHSTESISTQNSFCARYNSAINLTQEDESFHMGAFPIEEGGQIRKKLDSELDYDGETSWISEENVEGFLRSWCFEANGLNTSPAFTDTNGGSTKTSFSLVASEKHSQTKDKDDLSLYSYEQSLSSPSDKRNGSLQDKPSKCNKESMERSSMFDNCKQFLDVSKGRGMANSQTSSQCQLLNGGSLAQSHSLLPEHLDTQNLQHNPVGQVCQSEEGKSLVSDLLVCSPTNHATKHTKGSQEDARSKEKPCSEDKYACCSALHCKGTDKMALGARNGTSENQQQVQITRMLRPFCLEGSNVDNSPTLDTEGFMSLDTTVSSPEIHLTENEHWPNVAVLNEKASPSQGLSKRVPSHSEHRNYTKITRSLSFNEKLTSELEASSKQNTCNDLSELKMKSTSFSHYWIRNSVYSLDVSELLNDATKGSKEPDEMNSAKMLHGLKPQESSGLMEQELLKEVPGAPNMDTEHGGAHATLRLPNKSCMAASEIVTGEILVTKLKSSQQCCQRQLDNSVETLHRLQDVDNDLEDEACWQQFNVSDAVPKDSGKPEMYDKVILQETLNKGNDVGTKILYKYKNEQEQAERKKSEKSILPDQKVSKASMSYQYDNLIEEDMTEGSSKLCSPSLQDGDTSLSKQVMKTPSILSVYKNPLWFDENNTHFENHHTIKDEEFLDFTYCSERSIGFLDSSKSRLSFSGGFDDKAWDLYEGMGAFISPLPDIPCCTNKENVSETNDNFFGFTNSGDLDSLWDGLSDISKKLKHARKEVETGNASTCKSQVSESCSTSKDLINCELSGLNAKQKLTTFDQADQKQLLASHPQVTLKSNPTSQIALSSSCDKVSSVYGGNCNNLTLSSTPLICPERCLQVKDTSTTYTKVPSHVVKKPVSLDNCPNEQPFCPDSTSAGKTVMVQNVALRAREGTEHNLLQNAPSTKSTREESLLCSKMSCHMDEAKAGESVVNCDNRVNRPRQELCPSIKAPGVEHLYPLDNELSSVKATKENQLSKDPILYSNDETEASEEVKRVTFVYSDSKEPPHKNVDATLPDVPIDLPSTWVLSQFSSATKEGGNLKKREQKQLLEQEKSQEDQTAPNTLGEKVEVLEAEINKFKHENKKLQNLVKCMIIKMKQLQQGFRGRKRRGASRGFMTCIYSVRIQRSKSKSLRKS